MNIAGIAACVPKTVVETSLAFEHFPRHDVERIIGNTGVRTKRESPPGTKVSDLCIGAAEQLLDGLKWERESVDACVLVTTLADYYMPATSHRIAKDLGLPNRCLVFDINLGCSGFTHGLIVLEGLIKSGLIKRGLLLCGEMTSGTFRPRLPEARHRSDLANALLFGDAGTATAVTAGDTSVIVARDFGADGRGVNSIIVEGGAGAAFPSPASFDRQADAEGTERRALDLILKGPEVLTFTMKRVPRLMKNLCEQSGWATDDVDAIVPHQANKFMLDFLIRRMKLPAEKVLFSIQEFGNTSSASIPLTIVTQGAERLRQPTKWAFLGFGVGLSWSGIFAETQELFAPPLREL